MKANVDKLSDQQYAITLTLDEASQNHAQWAFGTLEGKDVATYLEQFLPRAIREEINLVIAKHERGCCM